MSEKFIKIRGARVNNLKDISVDIPLNDITCIVGPSGSGKSTLAFHTLYTESKRRFLNSFPSYLKFFSDRPPPVDVDSIYPVLPVFALPQINPVVGARSVVADVMGFTELVQELYAGHAIEKCPIHKLELQKKSLTQQLRDALPTLKEKDTVFLCATKNDYLNHFSQLPLPGRSAESFESLVPREFNQDDELWELARFRSKGLEKLDQKIGYVQESELKEIFVIIMSDEDGPKLLRMLLDDVPLCPKCDYSGQAKKQMNMFSPYNALGACKECGGFGAKLQYDKEKLFNIEKSVKEGGVRLLEYKRFASYKEHCLTEMKKNKFSTTMSIQDLPDEFMDFLYKGSGRYVGLSDLIDWLESKKYRPSVRIFIRQLQEEVECPACRGTRIKENVANFFISDQAPTYGQIWKKSIADLSLNLEETSLYQDNKNSEQLMRRLLGLLQIAKSIGLGHLSLLRKTKSLSAGEYQRLLLLKYLSYQGTGALFIFDEPSVGLQELECKSVLRAFQNLVKQGNTVLLVEHSHFFIKNSGHIIHLGPGAGHLGGEILYSGKHDEYLKRQQEKIDLPIKSSKKLVHKITVNAPAIYEKTYQSVFIYKEALNVVRGPSGCGKTSTMLNVLGNYLSKHNRGEFLKVKVGQAKSITGNLNFNDVIVIDSQLNRFTSRSTVGSMTGLFNIVRKHYTSLPQSKSMGLKEGHFSSNSELGQCSACTGSGVKIIEMQFLEDVVLTCEDCNGKKIKKRYATVSDGKLMAWEAFDRPISEVLGHVKLTPKFRKIWEYLKLLNLDYLSLDRPVNSLSGGEKQRLYFLSKLLTNISETIIFCENISFGLSDRELARLCKLLLSLSENKNTLVVIDQSDLVWEMAEHQIDY